VLNKCTNTNSNPQNTTNVSKTGDAASTLTVVDDSAALAAAGLSAYGPNVYCLDNSGGSIAAFAASTGGTGNTNAHSAVAWVRGGSGAIGDSSTSPIATFAASVGFVRRSLVGYTPAGTNQRMLIRADAGQVVYFTLNGLYEGSTAPAQDVVVQGSAAYGFGRPGLIFDGSDDELTLGSVPFPTGANASEVWVLCDQQAPPSDTGSRYPFSYGGGAVVANRDIRRIVTTGVNRARGAYGDGSTTFFSDNTAVDLSGRHVLRANYGANDIRMDVDGSAGTSTALTPATGSARTRIGGINAGTAASFWQGQIAAVLVTNPLSTDQASQLLTYLKARGGIA
jgi:hypothetical protein